MHATMVSRPGITRLTLVPRSEWAKHRSKSTRNLWHLFWYWLVTGKWSYLPLLLSRTGYLLAREKYSAFAIDRVYENRARGLGRIGRRMDRYLLDLPVHVAVRERFDFVVHAATEAICELLARDGGMVSVLSVPCGLVRDLCRIYGLVASRETAHVRETGRRLHFYGVDLDFEGQVLVEAGRRASRCGLPVQLVQANVMDGSLWSWVGKNRLEFSLVICIGLSPWLTAGELRMLIRRFADHLAHGGYVILDRFNRGRHSEMGAHAEIHANYHSDEDYRNHLSSSSMQLLRTVTLGDNEGTGYLLQKLS